MGGLGSGKRHRHCVKRLTVDYDQLNVQLLKRRGSIYMGSGGGFGPSRIVHVSDHLSGANRSTEFDRFFRVMIYSYHIVLTYPYAAPMGPSSTVVDLERTPCTFGGERVWFRCPNRRCGRRVTVLFVAGDIMCRKCAGLNYETQYQSRHLRNIRRSQLIRRRLGGSGSFLERFPDRPKGMRWARYHELCVRAAQAESFCWADVDSRLSKLKTRR
jgi:hypothetical protein